MSFLVRYPVGNTPVRDCQYWPTQLTGDTSFSDITQAMLMQMAWRVREWTVSAGSFEFNGVDPSTTQTWFMSGAWDEFIVRMKRKGPTWDDDGVYRDVTDERDILGPSNGSFINPPPRTLLNAGVFGGVALSSGTYRQPADNFPGLPSLFGGVTGDLLGFLSNFVLFNSSTQKFNTRTAYASGVFQTDAASPFTQVSFGLVETGGDASFQLNDSAGAPGFECGLEIKGEHTPITGVTEGTGTLTDITITPTRWWPYKNSQGLPVYNESTGATLRSPFS